MEIKFKIFVIPKTQNEFELLVIIPDDRMACNLDKSELETMNDIIKFLKNDNYGIYYSGKVDYDGISKKESTWIKYTFTCMNNQLLNFIKTNNEIEFLNKKEMEKVMAKNKAPYALWSITALKNDCKKRNFDTEDYESVTDKAILCEMLKQDDNSGAKVEPEVIEEKKVVEKVEVELEDDFEDLDEAEPEVVEVKEEKPVEKKSVAPGNKLPVKPKEEKKKEAPKTSTKSLIPINQKLKDAGLWIKGSQFLSNLEKQQLLDAKNQKERDVIYDLLSKKVSGISVTLSEKMKNVAAAKRINNDSKVQEVKKEPKEPEPKETVNIYDGKTLAELRAIAISRKADMEKAGFVPKKSDTVETLTEKLIKTDAA